MRENWTYKKLGEVCTSITDGSHNPPKGIEHSEYRMISSQNIFDDEIRINDGNVRFLTEEDHYKENKRTKLSKDVVLLTIVGTIGRACVLKGTEGFITLQRSVAALQPSPKVYPRFLMHGLIGNRRKLEQEAHGIAQRGIYLRQLSELEIPIPPLSEQQSIVAELDKINELISLKKAQLSDLDALAQSIFYDMFGDPIENEKGWEVKKLGEVCESDLGKTLNSAKDQGFLYPYLCAINILWNHIDLSTLKTTKFDDCELERYTVRKGDLLICEGGDIGRAAIWNKDETILYQNALHRVRFKNDIIPMYCLYYIWKLKQIGVLDGRYGKGVTIKHLVKSSLMSIPIPLPPLSLQQDFAKRIELIEQQKAQISSTIKDLETVLASRMQYWFD